MHKAFLSLLSPFAHTHSFCVESLWFVALDCGCLPPKEISKIIGLSLALRESELENEKLN
jgi:hypothetical protein